MKFLFRSAFALVVVFGLYADHPACAAVSTNQTQRQAIRSNAPVSAGAKVNEQLTPESVVSVVTKDTSSPWSIVLGLTLLTLLPALLLAMTPMVRLLVVFHFLRQALGTQTAPSNQILMGLALMMTWFLISPVWLR